MFRATGPGNAILILLVVCFLTACRSGRPDNEVTADVFTIAGLVPASGGRISSWDQTGQNLDCNAKVNPGEERTLAQLDGPGCIRHFYLGITQPGPVLFRELVLRMYWDGEAHASVEVPLGDFFLTANEAFVRRFSSALVTINPGTMGGGSNGYNAYFPMPFSKHARITLENQGARVSRQFCYQVDYEKYTEPLPARLGRFHAQWRREIVTKSNAAQKNQTQWGGKNLRGDQNYVILEAEGQGQVIGLLLNVENLHTGWYGEGDDMIFIDGEQWPPAYHGTGTEEVFGGGACPDHEFTSLYTGFHLVEHPGDRQFPGKTSMYRWYLPDPIRFRKSLRWTIEHGHANNFENDYSSVAYWYQSEPHKLFPQIPPAKERLPRMPDVYFRARQSVLSSQDGLSRLSPLPARTREQLRQIRREGHRLFQAGRYEEAIKRFEHHRRQVEKLAPKTPLP